MEEKEIKDRIEYAKNIHSEAIRYMEDVEDLFTGAYVLESELEDEEMTPVVPSKPRAILSKILAMLAVRAQLGLEVIPLKATEGEEKICTMLEKWLGGFQFAVQEAARKPIYRDWVFWFLLRGRGDLELRYIPRLANTDKLALRVLVDDPKTIFPVWGREGIGYYAKIYKVPAWEVQQMPVYSDWSVPDLSGKAFDKEVEVREYWDDKQCVAFLDGKIVYDQPNPFGFVPLAEAHAERTPLADMEWAAQSILFPIMNALKQQAQLMGKVTNAVDVFYWPQILVDNPAGESFVMSTGPGTSARPIPPGSKITVLQPTVNQALVQLLNNWLQGDINLFSIPEIAWGEEPGSLQSGRAISQVLGQVMDRIQDKKENLELAAGWHFGDLLKAVEKFGTGSKFGVTIAPEKKGARRALLEIGADDVAGHHRVECRLTPELPMDQFYKMRVAMMARQPGPDGQPLLPDPYLRREILEIGNPDEVEEELRAQMFRMTTPAIIAKERKDYLEQWKKEHKVSDEEYEELEFEGQEMMMGLMGATQEQPLLPEREPGAPEEGLYFPGEGTEEPTEEELQWP